MKIYENIYVFAGGCMKLLRHIRIVSFQYTSINAPEQVLAWRNVECGHNMWLAIPRRMGPGGCKIAFARCLEEFWERHLWHVANVIAPPRHPPGWSLGFLQLVVVGTWELGNFAKGRTLLELRGMVGRMVGGWWANPYGTKGIRIAIAVSRETPWTNGIVWEIHTRAFLCVSFLCNFGS